jgi:hypothetical protein
MKASPAPKRVDRRFVSPFICESQKRVPHSTYNTFAEALQRWDEAHNCVAWTGAAGSRGGDEGCKLLAGFDRLPGDDALRELIRELEPLTGPLSFTATVYADAEVGRSVDG